MFYVMWVRGARFKKFGAQLCEALELVARALRAGHSLAAAMQTVATEMPNPIAKEFGRVYEEQNLGISIEGAMRNLGERIPNMDLKFFVTSVIIQRQTVVTWPKFWTRSVTWFANASRLWVWCRHLPAKADFRVSC